MRKDLNILIIDDEQNSRELLQFLLSKYFKEKYLLCLASSATEAEKQLKNTDFDIVFSDSKMPFETSNHLIKYNYNKNIQFVICTALGKNDVIDKFDFPVYFLQKPIDLDDFNTICKLILDSIIAKENTLII